MFNSFARSSVVWYFVLMEIGYTVYVAPSKACTIRRIAFMQCHRDTYNRTIKQMWVTRCPEGVSVCQSAFVILWSKRSFENSPFIPIMHNPTGEIRPRHYTRVRKFWIIMIILIADYWWMNSQGGGGGQTESYKVFLFASLFAYPLLEALLCSWKLLHRKPVCRWTSSIPLWLLRSPPYTPLK